MLTVREARADDSAAWRALRLRALADAPDAFGETLAKARKRDDAHWRDAVTPVRDAGRLLVEHRGTPAGMAVIVATTPLRANLYAMWVAPEARRMGAGSALVTAALRWARERAIRDVGLRVSETQPGARALYAAHGFVSDGTWEPLRDGSTVRGEGLEVRLPPLVMGVVNVTPDSFSDGGAFLDPDAAFDHGSELAWAGADIVDVGGEATNPRAAAVGANEEMRRVLPVIERLAGLGRRVSIDTTKAAVARAAVRAGATIINDVSGGLFDAGMIETVRELGVTYIAGHLRGRTLAEVFAAEGTVSWQTVSDELVERIAGIADCWIDPGLGFGKGSDPSGNLDLLRHAGDIAARVGRPIVVGASRKRFVRRLAGLDDGAPRDLVDRASVAITMDAVRAGAHVVRVHNVALLHAALSAYNKK